MSRELKIVAAVFGGLFVLVLVAAIALVLEIPRITRAIVATADDPVAAKRTAEKIATFTLPKGYAIRTASDLNVTQLVTIAPVGRGRSAFQMQLRGTLVPAGTDATMRGMKIGMSLMSGMTHCDLRDDGVDEVVVRGVHVKLSIMQCSDARFPMRIEAGVFPGNANEASITAIGLAGEDFDTKALHALLESVR